MIPQHSELNISGTRLRAHIQKKPFTQRIFGIDYTYSMLPKKQKSFVFTNDRFLLVSGIDTISYARGFPTNVSLPFKSIADFPKTKLKYPLSSIQHCNTEQDRLIIQFSIQDDPKWQFMCPSKACAYEWRKRIQVAINQLERFKISKMERYEDYLANKRDEQQNMQARRQNEANKLYQTPQSVKKQPERDWKSTNGVVANTVDLLIQPEQRPPPEPIPLSMKYTQSVDIDQSRQLNRQEAITFSPNTSEIATLEKLILTDSPQSKPLINKSISTISINTRQNVISEIALLRRGWLQELIGHKEETELLMDFRKYVQRIIEVVVSELYIPQEAKIFPFREWGRQYASFVIDDIEIEIYFYGEQQLQHKHQREAYSIKQFKNYDYFLETTQNEGLLVVPFVVLFEYKGFTGMARTITVKQQAPYANKECLQELDLVRFRQDSRIDPRLLLEESKCKIVSFQPQRTSLSQSQFDRVFLIDRLSQFLPSQISGGSKEKLLLRPQLVQDSSLEEYVFGDRERQVGPFQIESLLAKQITNFIRICERQEEYFTNSKELSGLMHSLGLNMRHLGLVLKQAHQSWLKRILQAELAARCIKLFFRFDMQNCILNQTDRIDPKQRQTERQVRRVIAFLNILLGNTEATHGIWKSLNNYSRVHYEATIWDNRFQDINTHWLLQALQSHLNIKLSDSVHQKQYYKHANVLTESDFVQFSSDVTIYNLDFTETFEEIYDCLSQKNSEHFSHLSRMMTRQTGNGKPYLFMLKDHPIYDLICEYFLYFITPDEYHQFYSTLDEKQIPSRFGYECHLTQIKWFVKNKPEMVNKPMRFINQSGRRWLGQFHPIYVKMNHVLAQYYMDNPHLYSKALIHANQSLELQRKLCNGDAEHIWRDYFLIGRIHILNSNPQNGLPYLLKARQLVETSTLKTYEYYGQLMLMIGSVYYEMGNVREAYPIIKNLYEQLKQIPDEQIQYLLVECVKIIRVILQKNQQFQAYYKFVQNDYSKTLINAIYDPELLRQGVKLIVVPYLKYVIHQNGHIRGRMFQLIEGLMRVGITDDVCITYLQMEIKGGKFPREFFGVLKEVGPVMDAIQTNNMVDRWISFNKMSNQTLLERVGGAKLSRQFAFLAQFTAILGLLGQQARREFVFMEK